MEKERKIDVAKEEILVIVSDNPGILSVLLFDKFEGRLTRSHILYFLRSLEKEKKLKLISENKYMFCYLPEDDFKSNQAKDSRKKFVLENLNRKSQGRIGDVLDLVRANQGITKAGIAKKLELYRNTAGYYVDQLVKNDFIKVEDINHRKCCFTANFNRDFTYLNETEKKLLEIIERHPGNSEKELRKITDQRQQLLYRNLKNLLKKDKILREKKGSGVYRYYPAKTVDNEFDLFIDEDEE
jgi:predicted transcriptional regulator